MQSLYRAKLRLRGENNSNWLVGFVSLVVMQRDVQSLYRAKLRFRGENNSNWRVRFVSLVVMQGDVDRVFPKRYIGKLNH